MTFLEKASDAIRAAGGRITEQRQTLLRLLADMTERIDAETLHLRAQENDPQINLTTVYRTLETLEAAGLIRAQFVSPEHNRKYYTLAQEPYHFTCRRCHRVIAFSSTLIDLLKQNLELDYHVQTFNACVCVEGLCPDCLAQESKETHRMQTLDQLKPGEKAHVKRIGGQGAVRRRLMDMGLVGGVEVELIKAAPMGDPLEYRLRGYKLSLRKAEAQMVEIDK